MVKRALIFPLCANSPRNVKSVPEFGARQWSGLLISAHFVMKFRFPVFWRVYWWGPSPTSLFALTLTVRSRTQRAADVECESVALWYSHRGFPCRQTVLPWEVSVRMACLDCTGRGYKNQDNPDKSQSQGKPSNVQHCCKHWQSIIRTVHFPRCSYIPALVLAVL